MVRNLKGGTGTKALARKHQNSSNNGNVRLPSCNAEQFAFVSKIFGHGMCEVFTNDNTRLIAHIRNKFRGRQKRQNIVSSSSIILVGLREWETSPTNCDLLCVYDENDIQFISSLPNAPRNIFNRFHNNNNNDLPLAIDFDNLNDEHNDNLLQHNLTSFTSFDNSFNDI